MAERCADLHILIRMYCRPNLAKQTGGGSLCLHPREQLHAALMTAVRRA